MVGMDYQATTTSRGDGLPAVRVLKTVGGSLGSVVITGVNDGAILIYNASTSDATKRATSKATSSLLIAAISTSTPVGTYTFDVDASDGLLMVTTGNAPTSTITYR